MLDASECPPTFGVSPDLVQGVIAGGYEACYRAVEASEDDAEAAQRDLKPAALVKDDVLVGIAASGRTPYTVGAVTYARSLGAFTVAVTCAPDSPITQAAEVEHRSRCWTRGCYRFDAAESGHSAEDGSEHDLDCDDGELGYVTGNRMSNLQARNSKLRARAVRILMAETDLDENAAAAALDAGNGDIRIALVMSRTGCSAEVGKELWPNRKAL